MLFDAHTHIHFPKYDPDRREVILRAQKAEVKMLTVGTNLETSRQAIETAKQYSKTIWATVGFHPNHAVGFDWYHDTSESLNNEREKFSKEELRRLALNKEVVAIGECGLDYFREESFTEEQRKLAHQEQEKVFRDQADLALELEKPLMLHVRPSKGTDDAYEDVYEILGERRYEALVKILHFYVGGLEVTRKFVQAGYYFSVGGVITFADDYNESIRAIPLDRLMLETDAPYVAPKSKRGQRNESSFIVEVAQKLALIKELSYDEVEEQTSKNAERVFKITL